MQAHQIHQLLNTGMRNPETQVQHTWAPQRSWSSFSRGYCSQWSSARYSSQSMNPRSFGARSILQLVMLLHP